MAGGRPNVDTQWYRRTMQRFYASRGKTARQLDKETNSKRNTLRAVQTKSLDAARREGQSDGK
jgi:hypothetical protein